MFCPIWKKTMKRRKTDLQMYMDPVGAFIDACQINDLVKVMACVSTFGLDVNTLSGYGRSGLVEAARRNSEEVVEWLLAQPGIDVNIVSDNETALMAACVARHANIVKMLVQAPGIDLNWQSSHGYTAAHYAASWSAACVEAAQPGRLQRLDLLG